ncbi:MAG: glyceraldehyde 3-phosphate dehydrogenase NAD-binding domain-containing protein [bacterium]
MKIAINGLGRIGRQTYKILLERGFEVEAVNDLTDKKTLEYLLNFDSVYGAPPEEVKLPKNLLSEADPLKLPWKKLGVDLVIDCTGRFTKKADAKNHLKSGAKKVVISANSKDADLSVVIGVNHALYEPQKHHILAACSCTTNAAAPIVKILHNAFGVEKAFIATVHSFTASQALVDAPKKDMRDGRSAATNIVPSTTGAAVAVARVIPELEGKLDGGAYRVPTPAGSIVEITALLDRTRVTEEVINKEFIKQSQGRYEGIVQITNQPVVSSDILGPVSCMVDLSLTKVVGGNLVSVKVWYDNEWGYCERLADLVTFIATN